MAQWVTVWRAAHLVGVPRGTLQQRVRAGELELTDGLVSTEALLRLYPQAAKTSGWGESASTNSPTGPRRLIASPAFSAPANRRWANGSSSSRPMKNCRLRSSHGQLAIGCSAASACAAASVSDCPARKRRRWLRGVCRCSISVSGASVRSARTVVTMSCTGMSAGPTASRVSRVISLLAAVWAQAST